MTMHKSSLLPDAQTTGNSKDLEWARYAAIVHFERGKELRRKMGQWGIPIQTRSDIIYHPVVPVAIRMPPYLGGRTTGKTGENNNKTTAIKGHGSYTTTDH